MKTVVEDVFGGEFEQIRDIVKSMAVEVDSVKVMHNQVGTDNSSASVCLNATFLILGDRVFSIYRDIQSI